MERGDGEGVVGGNESVLDLWGGGVTLTSLVCHINNRAFGGNVATVPARWTNSTKDDEFLWDPRCQPYRRLAISSRIPSCPAKTREEGRGLVIRVYKFALEKSGRVYLNALEMSHICLRGSHVRYLYRIFYYESDFKYLYIFLARRQF